MISFENHDELIQAYLWQRTQWGGITAALKKRLEEAGIDPETLEYTKQEDSHDE